MNNQGYHTVIETLLDSLERTIKANDQMVSTFAGLIALNEAGILPTDQTIKTAQELIAAQRQLPLELLPLIMQAKEALRG